MSFEDDEPIVASQDVPGEKPAAILAGKTKVTIINKTTAPLEESKFKVMLELTGAGSGNDRPGVDLVTVLDVSGSMEGEKLEKMKIAMLFMIKKLRPIDRLSVVTFNGASHRLCPLRQITENSQGEIENLVNALVAVGGTNIYAGLQTGLEVLNSRRFTSGRAVGIMLMSDGQQPIGGDAIRVPVGNVPVCTFGLGAKHDSMVLNAIANDSMGGTFSHVRNQDNLSIAFSQCLAGLLTVVVQDLKLTVTKVESTIIKVSAGNYPQSKDDAAGSVTVSFGDLYNKEVRKVIVDLLIPAAPAGSNVLNITYTYSSGGKLFDAKPIIVTVSRTGKTSVEPEREEVMMEENRLRISQMIKESRVMADDGKRDGAVEKLTKAQSLLKNVVNDGSNSLIEMLKYELQQIKWLMKSQKIYESQGRPDALSSETSHNRQRYATRGVDVEKVRMFSTPCMDAYLEQAKSFDEDPRKSLPSVDKDEKPELAVEEDKKQGLAMDDEKQEFAVDEDEKQELAVDEEEKQEPAVDGDKKQELVVDEDEKQELAVDEDEKQELAVNEDEKQELAVVEDEKQELAVVEDEKKELAVEEDEKQELAVDEDEKQELAVDEDEKEELAVDEDEKQELAVNEDEKQELAVDEDEKQELAVHEDEKQELAVDEDEKQEPAAEPFLRLVGALSYCIQTTIQFFFSIAF